MLEMVCLLELSGLGKWDYRSPFNEPAPQAKGLQPVQPGCFPADPKSC